MEYSTPDVPWFLLDALLNGALFALVVGVVASVYFISTRD